MDRNRMGATALACVLLATTGSQAMAAACSTNYDQALDQARTLRMAGRLDQATATTQGVLRTDPDNLRAKYTLGLIQMDQADRSSGKTKTDLQSQGLAALTDVSKGVQIASVKASPAAKACLKDQGLFTVDNTLGSYFLRAGDVKSASLYLNKAAAYDRANLLTQDSHAKVSSNLGHLYFFLGDNAKAETYLQTAKKAGNKNPSIDNTLTAIKATTGPNIFKH